MPRYMLFLQLLSKYNYKTNAKCKFINTNIENYIQIGLS